MELLVPERWDRILGLLRQRGRIRVEEVVEDLGVSFTTARRDLRQMHQQGLVLRTRGGAVMPRQVGNYRPISQDRELNTVEKELIGRAAALLIEPGDTVMTDGGTTTSATLRHAPNAGITVVTNSLDAGPALLDKESVDVIFLGGTYLRSHNCTYGPITERAILNLRGDKAFVGAGGASARDGVTDPNSLTAQLKGLMSERCNQTIVVADHSKLGVATLFGAVPTSRISKLVTDSKADHSTVRELRTAGVTVIIAEEFLAQHGQEHERR